MIFNEGEVTPKMATVLERPHAEQDIRATNDAPPIRLVTVDEYYRMGDAGIFDGEGQVELFRGRIYKLSPKNPLHSATVQTAGRHLAKQLGEKCIVRSQEPVHFDDYSEPEPDIALVKHRADEYAKSHPTPEDCLLLIEVSLSTLRYDREEKGRDYAVAGIQQYMILNLKSRELEDYREPSPEGFRSKRTLRADEAITFVAFPEVEIKVGELPPPE